MIKKSKYGKHLKNEVSASVHLPYTNHITNTIIKTKDGDLLTVIKLAGISHETIETENLNILKNGRNNLFKSIANKNISIYSHLIRTKKNNYPPSSFRSIFSKQVDEKYKVLITKKDLFVNDLFISVTSISTNKNILKFTDSIKNLFSDTKKENSINRRAIKAHDDIVDKVLKGLSAYTPKVLSVYYKKNDENKKHPFSHVFSFLSFLLNRKWKEVPVNFIDASQSISFSKVSFEKDYFEIDNTNTRYGAIVSIKDYHELTFPGMLDDLLKLQSEYILTQSFNFISKKDSVKLLKTQRNRLVSSDDDGISQIKEIEDAIDQLTSNDYCMGYHHLSVSVIEDELNDLQHSINSCINVFSEIEISAVREYFGLEPAYWAQFPCNNSYITRKAAITSQNFASFNSLHNYPTGKINGNFWGDCVMLFRTISNTPYYFNFHYPYDQGNTTIIGGTGVGKTVLIDFLSLYLDKFNPVQVFFDKDKGSEIYIRTQNGIYNTIENGVTTGFNPFQLKDNKTNKAFLFELMKVILKGNNELKASDLNQIKLAIEGVYKLVPSERNISNFYEYIQYDEENGVKDRLNNWIKDGAYSWVFGSSTDELNLSNNYIGFDLTELLDIPAIRTPVLMYLFHCVESLTKGRRAVKFLDEGWKMLDDPYFNNKLKNDFKTIRKKNAFNVFGTQEPEDIISSNVGGTIMSQSPTKFYLPNPKAKESDYIDGFGLTLREFELIKNFEEDSRLFLLKQGNKSVVISLDLSELEQEVSILSTTEENQVLLTNIRNEVGNDPADFLPLFHTRRKK